MFICRLKESLAKTLYEKLHKEDFKKSQDTIENATLESTVESYQTKPFDNASNDEITSANKNTNYKDSSSTRAEKVSSTNEIESDKLANKVDDVRKSTNKKGASTVSNSTVSEVSFLNDQTRNEEDELSKRNVIEGNEESRFITEHARVEDQSSAPEKDIIGSDTSIRHPSTVDLTEGEDDIFSNFDHGKESKLSNSGAESKLKKSQETKTVNSYLQLILLYLILIKDWQRESTDIQRRVEFRPKLNIDLNAR